MITQWICKVKNKEFYDEKKLKKLPNYKLASFFTSIFRDKIHSRVFLNSSEPVSLEEIKEDVDLVVEIFLNGIKK